MSAKRKSRYAIFLQASLAAVLTVFITACGSGGPFGTNNPTSPGNTSKIPPENSLWVLGTPGTPFQAVITDSAASWTVKGVIPESVVVVNNSPGLQMTVTKLTNSATLLSAEIITGTTLVQESSTNDPFGTVVVQTSGGVAQLAPHANPDTRFFIKGPSGGLFSGLVEDLSRGFIVEARSPAVLLFEKPNGRVDGEFSSLDFAGSFAVDILAQGAVVVQATGGPNLIVKYP